MLNEELVNYIKIQLQNGVPIENIKITTLQTGWSLEDVESAIILATQPEPVQALENTPTSKKVAVEKEEIIIPDDLINYIKSQIEKKKSKIEIESDLKNAGWKLDIVEKAISKAIETKETVKIPIKKNKEEETIKTKELIPLTRRIDLGENIKITYTLLKEKLSVILGIQSVLFLSTQLFTIIEVLSGFISNIRTIIIIYAIAILFLIIIITWTQSALIKAIAQEEGNVLRLFQKSAKKIFPLITTSFVLFGISITGSTLFLIPLLPFSIWFIFSYFITVTEDKKGAEALAYSRSYVRGNFGIVFGNSLLIAIILLLIFLILNNLESILFPEDSFLINIWILVKNIIQISILTIAEIFIFTLFQNIKNLHDTGTIPKAGFIWSIRIITIIGYLIILGFIILAGFLIGNALWDAYKELSETGEFSIEIINQLWKHIQDMDWSEI